MPATKVEELPGAKHHPCDECGETGFTMALGAGARAHRAPLVSGRDPAADVQRCERCDGKGFTWYEDGDAPAPGTPLGGKLQPEAAESAEGEAE